jgi:hypothetical protein
MAHQGIEGPVTPTSKMRPPIRMPDAAIHPDRLFTSAVSPGDAFEGGTHTDEPRKRRAMTFLGGRLSRAARGGLSARGTQEGRG